jgi:hypothetical protein
MKPAFFGEIHGCVNIAFPAGELHALNVLDQLAVLQTFVFWKVLFLTVLAWR